MHPNPAFRGTARDQNLAFARARAFGTLAVNGADGPLLSHIPFLLSDSGDSADLHLVRSNPIARLPAGPAVISISGPDAYISPDWYQLDDQVPTWNYIAVHLRGHLDPLPVSDLEDLLTRQSAHFEIGLAPKRPWTMGKMTPEVRDRMMRQILPFRLTIETVDGTWKLNQNKPEAARLSAADALDTSGQTNLAELMRKA